VIYITELRDLYDINSNKTNKTYRKGDLIPEGYYPMVVMVVIRNSNGEFLMQKRVESKGGDWGVTGGHPKSGETPIEGIITEVKEELGLDFSKENFIEYDSGCDGKDCYKMYFVTKDININDITIQQEELSEVRWFTMDELKGMVNSGELNEDQIACFNKVCNYLKNN
jgi:8-oxo-dGTP pyrophosphatase MutT (NUDIX family)